MVNRFIRINPRKGVSYHILDPRNMLDIKVNVISGSDEPYVPYTKGKEGVSGFAGLDHLDHSEVVTID